jgi:hypothetical protein
MFITVFTRRVIPDRPRDLPWGSHPQKYLTNINNSKDTSMKVYHEVTLFPILRARKEVPYINSHPPLSTLPLSYYAPHYNVLPCIPLEASRLSIYRDAGSGKLHWLPASFVAFSTWPRCPSETSGDSSLLHGVISQKIGFLILKFISEYRPVAGCCWHGNELTGSLRGGGGSKVVKRLEASQEVFCSMELI